MLLKLTKKQMNFFKRLALLLEYDITTGLERHKIVPKNMNINPVLLCSFYSLFRRFALGPVIPRRLLYILKLFASLPYFSFCFTSGV